MNIFDCRSFYRSSELPASIVQILHLVGKSEISPHGTEWTCNFIAPITRTAQCILNIIVREETEQIAVTHGHVLWLMRYVLKIIHTTAGAIR